MIVPDKLVSDMYLKTSNDAILKCIKLSDILLNGIAYDFNEGVGSHQILIYIQFEIWKQSLI